MADKTGRGMAQLEKPLVETAKWAQAVRRQIHQHPETGFNEVETSRLVAKNLRAFGIEVRTGIAKTGVVGLLRGSSPGKTIGLRADIDALPMQEKTGLPYASRVRNVMHACGHDGHTAILLGAAKVLAGLRKNLKGNVKFLFQPAEEAGGGCPMVKAGVMRNPNVDIVYALHGLPSIPCGKIGLLSGPHCAEVDQLEIRITGKGCHGAHPERGIDPVFLSAVIIQNLQSVVSRRIGALDQAVVSICRINGGSAFNIIPDQVELLGTIRTFDPKIRSRVIKEIKSVCSHSAAIHGGTAQVTISENIPVVINDENAIKLARVVAGNLFGRKNIAQDKPTMGGEDFCYFLHQAPGAFINLGTGTKKKDDPSLHSPFFDFNDRAIYTGIKLWTGLALEYLKMDP